MPSRSTATRGLATTKKHAHAVRKTTKTSTYFKRSQRTKPKAETTITTTTTTTTQKKQTLQNETRNESSDHDGPKEKERFALLDASHGETDDVVLWDSYDDDSSALNEYSLRVDNTQEDPKTQISSKSTSPRKKKPPPKLSPYFPKPLPLIDSSCLPFPSISATSFGLVQEQLCDQPFRLLVATIILNRTRGPVAIPILFKLFAQYPSIHSMANANHEDIVSLIQTLGFQNQRATKFIALAKTWLENPPQRNKRYRKLHYPCKGDGADVASDEVVVGNEEEDARVAWEIAHLPGVGAYAIDSWRIFCRDFLLHIKGEEEKKREPEWKRVLPRDKELRAYLTWMWLKEGWLWDPETGDKTRADAAMMKRAQKGGVAYEAPNGNWVLEEDIISIEKKNEVLSVKRAGFSLDYPGLSI